MCRVRSSLGAKAIDRAAGAADVRCYCGGLCCCAVRVRDEQPEIASTAARLRFAGDSSPGVPRSGKGWGLLVDSRPDAAKRDLELVSRPEAARLPFDRSGPVRTGFRSRSYRAVRAFRDGHAWQLRREHAHWLATVESLHDRHYRWLAGPRPRPRLTVDPNALTWLICR
jgi:hypothetical protein